VRIGRELGLTARSKVLVVVKPGVRRRLFRGFRESNWR
jgi:hypothetical protein